MLSSRSLFPRPRRSYDHLIVYASPLSFLATSSCSPWTFELRTIIVSIYIVRQHTHTHLSTSTYLEYVFPWTFSVNALFLFPPLFRYLHSGPARSHHFSLELYRMPKTNMVSVLYSFYCMSVKWS